MASKLRLQIEADKRTETWNPEKALAEALAERALFLENHPKYKTFQDQINKLLDKAGNAENRMAVLAMLMESKLLELQKELRRLNTILLKATARKPPQNIARGLISSN
jgi:bacterioferritin (cytochrome b1)